MGAGLGHDRALGARLPPGLRRHRIRRRHDRHAQSLRLHRFRQPALVHPALTQHHLLDTPATPSSSPILSSPGSESPPQATASARSTPGHQRAAEPFSCASASASPSASSFCAPSTSTATPPAGPRSAPPSYTVLSFLNTTKYPPSLLFLLMTLGPALLFLWAVDAHTPRLLRPALIIGKVPMFYFLLHFAFIHLLAVIICYARYGHIHWMFESPDIAHFPDHATSRMGTHSAVRLSHLGLRRHRDVSALPLVRRREAAQQQSVAQLSLIARSPSAASACATISYAPLLHSAPARHASCASRSRSRSPSKSK